jgi:hypothetical protein
MSNNLSYFLAGNVIKEEVVKYAASKRIVDDKKKPVDWEIACVTSDEDEAIRKSCTRKVQVPGKKNMFAPECDYDKYLCKLAVRCTVSPDLNNAELQDSYKVMGAEKLLQTMLKPGEYQDYLKKVQETNGFDVGTDELVEDAKN